MKKNSAATAVAPTKADVLRKILNAKRKNPLTFGEIKTKIEAAGFAKLYRSEVTSAKARMSVGA
jgi:hypothetical protein